MNSFCFFRILSIGFILFSPLFISCESTKSEQIIVADSVSAIGIDSSVETESKAITAQETSEEESEMALKFIVSVAEGYDYDSIHRIALQASQFLGYAMDTAGTYYNKKKKSIILSEDNEDDMWAGAYMFRRYGEEKISIEMRYAYTDTIIENNETLKNQLKQDTTRLFVCADITNEAEAIRLQKKLLLKFPNTRIIAAEIYMGCMH